jgi:hypothetical protein
VLRLLPLSFLLSLHLHLILFNLLILHYHILLSSLSFLTGMPASLCDHSISLTADFPSQFHIARPTDQSVRHGPPRPEQNLRGGRHVGQTHAPLCFKRGVSPPRGAGLHSCSKQLNRNPSCLSSIRLSLRIILWFIFTELLQTLSTKNGDSETVTEQLSKR